MMKRRKIFCSAAAAALLCILLSAPALSAGEKDTGYPEKKIRGKLLDLVGTVFIKPLPEAESSLMITENPEEEELPSERISWEEDGTRIIEENPGLYESGSFVDFEDIGMKLWVPSYMESAELTDSDYELGCVAFLEEEACTVGIASVEFSGSTGNMYKKFVGMTTGADTFEDLMINGERAVRFVLKDADAEVIGFPMRDGYASEFTFSPSSADGFSLEKELMIASIMDIDAELVLPPGVLTESAAESETSSASSEIQNPRNP